MLLMTAPAAMPMPTEKAFDVERPANSKKYVEYPIIKTGPTSCEIVKTPMATQHRVGQSINTAEGSINTYFSSPEIHSPKAVYVRGVLLFHKLHIDCPSNAL